MELSSSWKRSLERKTWDRVYVTPDLKPSAQCIKAANKARSVLRMVKRHFPKIDKDDLNILYKKYIRPHMEFCI